MDQLAAEQGTGPIEDVALLCGDFWPEEDSAAELVTAVDRWRADGGSTPQA